MVSRNSHYASADKTISRKESRHQEEFSVQPEYGVMTPTLDSKTREKSVVLQKSPTSKNSAELVTFMS